MVNPTLTDYFKMHYRDSRYFKTRHVCEDWYKTYYTGFITKQELVRLGKTLRIIVQHLEKKGEICKWGRTKWEVIGDLN